MADRAQWGKAGDVNVAVLSHADLTERRAPHFYRLVLGLWPASSGLARLAA